MYLVKQDSEACEQTCNHTAQMCSKKKSTLTLTQTYYVASVEQDTANWNSTAVRYEQII